MDFRQPFDPPPNCPECGYVLQGLDGGGRCPECGWAMGEAVVYFPSPWGSPGVWYDPLLIVAASCNAVLAISMFRGSRWGWTAFLGGSVLFLIYLMGKRLWLRRKGPPVAQVRFGPAGVARREGFGPVRWRPWGAGQAVELRPVVRPGREPAGWYRLRVRGPGWRSFSANVKLADGDAGRLLGRVEAFRRAVLASD